MRAAIFAALLLSSFLALAACSGGGAAVPSSEQPAASGPATQPTATPADPDPNRHPPAIPLPADLLPSEPGEEGARAFVAAFLEAREGDAARARDFLAPTALEQTAAASLTGASGWEIVSFAAADANSYEVRVRGRSGAGTVEETLFVGPGNDASGASRVWIVRGIAREGSQP